MDRHELNRRGFDPSLHLMKKILLLIILLVYGFGLWLYFSIRPVATGEMEWGVSFGIVRADDMKLDWKKAYDAILNDLKPKHLRLIAYWPLIEPKQGQYDFRDMDYQMDAARAHGADVILAIGRRVPGYPECHDPGWLGSKSKEDQKTALLAEIKAIVERYKSRPELRIWQVENEPFFDIFTSPGKLCPPSDPETVAQEIALVRQLDPKHKILVTDAGELGLWVRAYQAGDVFGTSVYQYVWNRFFGYIEYPIGPWFFRIRQGFMNVFYGDKPEMVAELQAEPWVPKPLVQVPVEEQLTRLDIDKMERLVAFPPASGYDQAYLWGAEWWYWMKTNGHPEFWNRARDLFLGSK